VQDIEGLMLYHRINVNEDYEMRDWAHKFGVSPSG